MYCLIPFLSSIGSMLLDTLKVLFFVLSIIRHGFSSCIDTGCIVLFSII